jgi:hypothetical protein
MGRPQNSRGKFGMTASLNVTDQADDIIGKLDGWVIPLRRIQNSSLSAKRRIMETNQTGFLSLDRSQQSIRRLRRGHAVNGAGCGRRRALGRFVPRRHGPNRFAIFLETCFDELMYVCLPFLGGRRCRTTPQASWDDVRFVLSRSLSFVGLHRTSRRVLLRESQENRKEIKIPILLFRSWIFSPSHGGDWYLS